MQIRLTPTEHQENQVNHYTRVDRARNCLPVFGIVDRANHRLMAVGEVSSFLVIYSTTVARRLSVYLYLRRGIAPALQRSPSLRFAKPAAPRFLLLKCRRSNASVDEWK